MLRANLTTSMPTQKGIPAMCIRHPSSPSPRLVDGATAESILSAKDAQYDERVKALTYFLSVVTDVDFRTAGPEVHEMYAAEAKRTLANLTKAPGL